MGNIEEFMPQQGQLPESAPESEQEKRARLISRYIETRVIGANEGVGEEEEKEISEFYKKINPREKADTLYSKLMAYALDKQAEAERKKQVGGKEEDIGAETADPYFISEIKVLFSDSEMRDIFSDTYAEARVDAKKFRFSELGNLYQTISKEVERKEDDYKRLEKDLHLGKIAGEGRVSSAKSRMARLADNLDVLNRQKKEMEELDGMPKTAENTDAAANFQYEKLKNYKEQLDKGFVWLPSRKKIHQKTVSAVLNNRWHVLIGEAGSGK